MSTLDQVRRLILDAPDVPGISDAVLALQELVADLMRDANPKAAPVDASAAEVRDTKADHFRNKINANLMMASAGAGVSRATPISAWETLRLFHNVAEILTEINEGWRTTTDLLGQLANRVDLEMVAANIAGRLEAAATELRSHVDAWTEADGDTDPVMALVSVAGAVANALDPDGDLEPDAPARVALCPNCATETEVEANPTVAGLLNCVVCGSAFAEQDVS